MKYLLVIIFIIQVCNAQDLKMRENYNTELSSIVGNLTSSNIYLIYLSQDLIYKSSEITTIKESEIKVLATSLLSISSQIALNLKELYQIVESQQDADLILEVISVYEELKLSNDLLEKYLKEKNDNNKEKFLKQQKSVWDKLKKIN